jgi:hypothetical protein
MARVNDHVVHSAFMNDGRLGFSHSCNAIWPQRLPGSCNLAVALNADPQHPQSTNGRSKPFLTTSAVKKYFVNDDASPAGSDRGNADVPGRCKGPPPRTDIDLPGFPNMKERSILNPIVGHRPDQIVDAE